VVSEISNVSIRLPRALLENTKLILVTPNQSQDSAEPQPHQRAGTTPN